MNIPLPKTIKQFSSHFEKAGYELYLVGGALRNIVAGMKPKDFDFATSAKPEQVTALFRKVIPTGIKHGTVTVLFGNYTFEVTTFRVDGEYTNARHPDSIRYTADIYEDLKRRDFSINAMAYNIEKNVLLDPHNGQKHLKKKIISAIGIAEERFNEDGLRLMRACRFAAQLDCSIAPDTLKGMKATVKTIQNVSAERIMDELIKIMSADKPSISFEIMKDTGLLKFVLPDLFECIGIMQKGLHEYDIFTHCLKTCDAAPKGNLIIRLAALFHDIGKKDALEKDSKGYPTFYNHERYSARIAEHVLLEYKFPKKIIRDVTHLIENHMFNYLPEWSDSAVRRFIAKVGIPYIEPLFMLRYADQAGTAERYPMGDTLKEFRTRINRQLEQQHALTVKDLAINGNTLIKTVGLKPGPQIGIILHELLETVLDDPTQNNRDTLLRIAENLKLQYGYNQDFV